MFGGNGFLKTIKNGASMLGGMLMPGKGGGGLAMFAGFIEPMAPFIAGEMLKRRSTILLKITPKEGELFLTLHTDSKGWVEKIKTQNAEGQEIEEEIKHNPGTEEVWSVKIDKNKLKDIKEGRLKINDVMAENGLELESEETETEE